MESERLQAIAARDQLWSSLRPLLPEISRLAAGEQAGTERQQQLITLLARIVAEELRFRGSECQTDHSEAP